MFGAILDASGSVCVFSLWIFLPTVGDGVVDLHRGTFLLANSIIEKVPACQAIGLFGPRAASSAEKMTAFPWLGTKTSSGMALGGAVDFREPLTVSGSFSPASMFAGFMAGGAVSFGLREVVDVDILGGGPSDDFVPLDGLDVAEVVVIENANGADENVS